MRKKSLICLVLILMFVLSACGDKGTSEESSSGGDKKVDKVLIGTLHPLTGALAMEGQEMSMAVQMAVDEVNAAGGIQSLGGAKVEVVKGDHQLREETAVTETQRLIDQGVLGIVGPYGTALAGTQEAERQQTPFMIDVAVADEITERGLKYTFRIQPNATMMVDSFSSYLNDLRALSDTKVETAVLSFENSEFGTKIAEDIEKRAEQLGLKIIDKIPHNAAAADFSSEVTRIISAKPDVLIVTTYLNDGTQIVRGLNQNGFKPTVLIGVANGAFSNPEFIGKETNINQHILDVNYSVNPKAEQFKVLKKKFQDEYSKNFGPNAAYSYTSAKVLLQAIENAGTTDKSIIRDEIAKTKYTDHVLPQGAIEFNETGQNPNARAVLTQIFDGELKVVLPEEYSEVEPIFPNNK